VLSEHRKTLFQNEEIVDEKKEKFQIILNGKTIIGTRYLIRDEQNSLQQVIEYDVLRSQDITRYRKISNSAEMLWIARRILADLFEESCASANDCAVNIQ